MLSRLYEEYAEHHKQFEVIAVLDSNVRSLAELDEQMRTIVGEQWTQHPPKFPLAIDRNGETVKAYSAIRGSAYRVIDPDGYVVGDSLRALERRLPPRRPSGVIERYFDIIDEFPGGWITPTIKQALNYFQGMLRQEVLLDPATAEAENITEETEIPIFVRNVRLSLRGLEQLMFHPMGLAIVADDENGQLLLRASSRDVPPLSSAQHESREKLRQRLQGPAGNYVSDLALEETPLEVAIDRIASHFELPLGIHSTVLDRSNEQVSGVVVHSELMSTLNAMVAPLGLWFQYGVELLMLETRPRIDERQ